ncbi:MAG: HPr family phosphocarrier protein [Spirochaetia bacterium]|nr:HPr family phosphocarrier protein [Spirochaetia bacterium]
MEFKRKVKIVNKAGFHLRAVAMFVGIAEKFRSDVKVLNGPENIEADGKSIMGLTTLGAGIGVEIEIKACGPDAKEAVNRLVKLVSDGFGEDKNNV